MEIGEIILKRGKSVAVKRRHPWIFSGAIFKKKNCQSGQLVKVFDEHGEFLCQGHFHNGSIAVRILSFKDEPINDKFWKQRISDAWKLRQDLGLIHANNNAFRLIHGEGDGLSGLIIDIYNSVAVIQCHTVAMYNSMVAIQTALKAVLPDRINTIYNKLPAHGEGVSHLESGLLSGDAEDVVILENGMKFRIDLVQGQKTGFFLDQRENRLLLSDFSKGKTVTNLFSYTGGFSVYAGHGGASKITSVDISEKAIDLCNTNMELNGFSDKHKGIAQDVMKYLKEIPDKSEEVMIVDPPAFAKSRKRSHNAVQAYKRLNARAIQCMKKDSWIFTFSCSQVIGTKLFQDTITAAAIEAEREVQIIRHLSQGGDHPINIFHPEGKYLKGLLLKIH